jgi:CRP/FNR family transcriptional regulator, nitrogen oxide reductase regulator
VRTDANNEQPSQNAKHARSDLARRLRRSPLFRNVRRAEILEVLHAARVRRVRRGGSYFRQGDPALAAYVLTSGRVSLIRSGSGVRRSIPRFISPWEPFGLEAALGERRHTVSAQAGVDSEAVMWPAPALTCILSVHPLIAHNGLRLMGARIQGAWERFHALLTEPLERRTASALLALGTRMGHTLGGGPAVELRLPRHDLAAFVGATPYAISRIIGRWKRRGIVDAGRGWVVVVRPRMLITMVGNHELARSRR